MCRVLCHLVSNLNSHDIQGLGNPPKGGSYPMSVCRCVYYTYIESFFWRHDPSKLLILKDFERVTTFKNAVSF